MIAALLVLGVAAVGGALGALLVLRSRSRRPPAPPPPDAARILFPFVGTALSERALEACLRLAHAEHAVLVPAYLVSVPMAQHLDAPLPRACDTAFELLETIEQRAHRAGVTVDARIGRGRTLRHAMRQLMATERYDRIVAPAGGDDFTADDVAWLLRHATGEVVVLRPADDRYLRAHHANPTPPRPPPAAAKTAHRWAPARKIQPPPARRTPAPSGRARDSPEPVRCLHGSS